MFRNILYSSMISKIFIYLLVIIGCLLLGTLMKPQILNVDNVDSSLNHDIKADFSNVLSNLGFSTDETSIQIAEYFKEKAAKSREDSICVYNRVPKCGSRNVMYVFRTLSQRNNYTYLSSKEYNRFDFSRPERESQVNEILHLKRPSLFDRHMHFINFTAFTTKENPFYINVIREPIEQYVSFYYFVRHDPLSIDRLTGFTEAERNMVSATSDDWFWKCSSFLHLYQPLKTSAKRFFG